MPADLEALSREIAATSDAWMQRGVSGVTPDGRLWLWTGSAWIDDCYMPASEDEDGSEVAGIWPNLDDGVTVNSLLGSVGKIAFIMEWIALIDKQCATSDDRTTAICRAWIAAHKEKGNG